MDQQDESLGQTASIIKENTHGSRNNMAASSSNSKLKDQEDTNPDNDKKGSIGTFPKKNNNPYNRPSLGKCFRCSQQAHLSNECPQRRNLAIQEEHKMMITWRIKILRKKLLMPNQMMARNYLA